MAGRYRYENGAFPGIIISQGLPERLSRQVELLIRTVARNLHGKTLMETRDLWCGI